MMTNPVSHFLPCRLAEEDFSALGHRIDLGGWNLKNSIGQNYGTTGRGHMPYRHVAASEWKRGSRLNDCPIGLP